MQSPILITGAARSGTSLVAGIIHRLGAFGGNLSGPTRFNPKGMFENNRIREAVLKPLLLDMGCDPMGQNPLPKSKAVDERCSTLLCAKLHKDITSIMKEDGYKGGLWFYKGAKMCLLWQMFHCAFPDAKWVIVRRNKDDIVRSCLRTGFMRAFKYPAGWERWVAIHEERFDEMREGGLTIKEVWPQRLIDGDLTEVQELVEWLGLVWKHEIVAEFIAPKLWGTKK